LAQATDRLFSLIAAQGSARLTRQLLSFGCGVLRANAGERFGYRRGVWRGGFGTALAIYNEAINKP
jgi:hypothetical protein